MGAAPIFLLIVPAPLSVDHLPRTIPLNPKRFGLTPKTFWRIVFVILGVRSWPT